jgi:hypothetical protein
MNTATDPFGTAKLVNTITAGPLLSLMLAFDGMEGPGEPLPTWEAFKRFAQLPSSSVHDLVGFYVAWLPDPSGEMFLSCSWFRELTDDAGGQGEDTRIVRLEYGYTDTLLRAPQETELWSDAFRNLPDFFAAVEKSSQFRFIVDTAANFCGVHVNAKDDEVDVEE